MAKYSHVVEWALKELGADLQDARKRRRIKTALMAERLGVTRATLDRMEKGEPTVSMGVYMTAIYALDPAKLREFTRLFSREKDVIGLNLADLQLPKRIRKPLQLCK
jgi:transcriptional regulator with XRE-family HTH domain